MAATSHSTRTNIINVQRLLDRLESPETASKPAASLTGLPADEEYYAVLGMISFIKHAKHLVEASEGSQEASRDLLISLRTRLDSVQQGYERRLESTTPPKTISNTRRSRNKESLRPKAIPSEKQETPDRRASLHELGSPVDELLALGGEEEAETPVQTSTTLVSGTPSRASLARPIGEAQTQPTQGGAARQRPRDSDANSHPSKDGSSTQNISSLLSHHRSEQESLTAELADMANRLKQNSLQFSGLLQTDKNLLENAELKLEKNLTNMQGQQTKLKGYTKKGGVTFWFTIGAVISVALAWFFMFALMRIA